MRAHVLAACLVGAVLRATANGQPGGDHVHVIVHSTVGENDKNFVWRDDEPTDTRVEYEEARWRRAPPSPPGPTSGSGKCAQGVPHVLARFIR